MDEGPSETATMGGWKRVYITNVCTYNVSPRDQILKHIGLVIAREAARLAW